MLGKSPDQNQMNLFRGTLKEFINTQHPMVILADKIPWEEINYLVALLRGSLFKILF